MPFIATTEGLRSSPNGMRVFPLEVSDIRTIARYIENVNQEHHADLSLLLHLEGLSVSNQWAEVTRSTQTIVQIALVDGGELLLLTRFSEQNSSPNHVFNVVQVKSPALAMIQTEMIAFARYLSGELSPATKQYWGLRVPATGIIHASHQTDLPPGFIVTPNSNGRIHTATNHFHWWHLKRTTWLTGDPKMPLPLN